MKTLPAVLTMVAVALGASVLIVGRFGASGTGALPAVSDAASDAAPTSGMPPPWRIQVHASDSIEALGLELGHSTLGDAVQRYGVNTQVAVIAAPGEDGRLEAFVDPFQADFIGGKLIISAEATREQLQGWRTRAVKGEFMESTTRRYVLATNDLVEALKSRVVGLSFIPQAQLDDAAVVARFGEPAERVQTTTNGTHLLYPSKGVDVMIDPKGKELIQYVTPADFDARLRAPLRQAQAAR